MLSIGQQTLVFKKTIEPSLHALKLGVDYVLLRLISQISRCFTYLRSLTSTTTSWILLYYCIVTTLNVHVTCFQALLNGLQLLASQGLIRCCLLEVKVA